MSKLLSVAQEWTRRHPHLTGLLAAALVLRSATLLWGVPLWPEVGFYHGDEGKSWSSAAAFPEIYLSSTNYLYGTAVQYAVGLVMFPAKIALVYGLGWDAEFQLLTIVVFRAVNVALGTATVALTYNLGRRAGGERLGLIAAALLCVAFGPALHAALTTLDVPMAFLLAAGLLQLLRAAEGERTKDYVWAGVWLGLLCGTKVTGVLYCGAALVWLAAAIAIFPTAGLRQAADSSRRWSLVILTAATALGVFIVSTPHLFLGWQDYLKFMQSQKQLWYDQAPSTLAGIGSAWWMATATAIGAPAAILAAVGLAFSISVTRLRLLVLLPVLATYGFWLGYLVPRFVFPVSPLLCLLAALPIDRLLGAASRLARVAGYGALAIALGWSAVMSCLGIADKWFDPRTRAARYIADHIPAGASIGTATDHGDQWQHHAWRYPAIDFRRYQDIYFVDRPDYVVVTQYELDSMRAGLRDPEHKRDWYLGKPPPPEVFAFYQDLFAGQCYRLMASFHAPLRMPFDGACPAVYLYERMGSGRPPQLGQARPPPKKPAFAEDRERDAVFEVRAEDGHQHQR